MTWHDVAVPIVSLIVLGASYAVVVWPDRTPRTGTWIEEIRDFFG